MDDEESILHLSREKFSVINVDIVLVHLKSTTELDDRPSINNLNQFIYLFDLELIESEQNGIDLIKCWDLYPSHIGFQGAYSSSTYIHTPSSSSTTLKTKFQWVY